MFTRESYDPVLFDRQRRERPRLHANHVALVRIAYAEGLEELATLDAELDVLAARRRRVVDRLESYRRRLWPDMPARQHRRVGRPGEIPVPPAPIDARPLSGVILRRVAVAVLARHGALPLRELHGLLHRYGFEIEHPRSVQRLADALAYEVKCGRVERVARGVYGLAPDAEQAARRSRLVELPEDPLPWADPTGSVPISGEPLVDVGIVDDPERWSDSRWPAAAQLGASHCTGSPDRDARAFAEDLDVTVAATRARLAELITRRLGPLPPQMELGTSDRLRAAFFRRQQECQQDVDDPAEPAATPTAAAAETDAPAPPPAADALWTDSSTNRSIGGRDGDEDGEAETGGVDPPGSATE